MASAKDKIIKILETIENMEELGFDKESIDRAKAKLSQETKTTSWEPGQAFSILEKAKNDDERKRQDLLKFYTKANDFLVTLDEKLFNLLQKHVGNIQENMTYHTDQLKYWSRDQQKEKGYFLLVAGETCSGKSSLVNLILGEAELLPYSVLCTTSTICELKYGEERKLVAHFKDKDPETGELTKTIILEKPTGSPEDSYLQQIAPYVHMKSDHEGGSIFKKIELFWPHSLLQKGVVIVDSPGVGETDEMDEMVIQYLPQAFAFIYVINCTNAGGIQKNRLVKLLQEVQKVSPGVGEQEHLLQGHLVSKCALFVCNKWDQVSPKEREKVKNHVTRKLQTFCPGIDLKSQIIYISTTTATKVQAFGYITEDFSSLMDGMKTVVLKSIDIRLEDHWRWLDYLLSRIVFQAKAFVVHASSRDPENDNKRMTQIIRQLDEMEKLKDEVIAKLRKDLNERVEETVQQLSEYLSSQEVIDRFTSWSLDEVPKPKSSREETEYDIQKVLLSRFQEIIEEWEERNKVFENARRNLLQHFQESYKVFEDQLQNLQTGVIADGFPEILICRPSRPWVTRKVVVWSLAIAATIGLHLMGVSLPGRIDKMIALGVGFLGQVFLEDEGNACYEMAKMSSDFLAAVVRKDKLKLVVQGKFKQAKVCLEKIESRIPELIQADKMLCKELKRTEKEKRDLYRAIMDQGSEFRGKLMEFGIKEVCAADVSPEELDWKEDSSSLLGIGAFGAVYQGTSHRNGNVKTVALKVFSRDVLDARNACSLMEEVKTLRRLYHPNIVEFYGTSLLRKKNTVQMILVMEKCKGNLKSQIFESAPGKSEDLYDVRMTCRWVQEITDALAYIHEQGIVHRDLKLENILLSNENSVKIADLGVAKLAVDILGTFAGTPLYMAPEVFHSKLYNSQADIYSLGIILWEMWYGKLALIPAETLLAMFAMVDEGYRPADVKGCKPPPNCWKELMEKCWKGNPEERPTAESCKNKAKMIVSFFEASTPVGF